MNKKYLKDLRKIAESEPSKLLFSPRFWWSQKSLIFIIVVTILLSPYILKFSYQNSEILAITFNVIIHFVALWGLISTIKVLAEMEVENAIVKYIEERGMNHLEAINRRKIRRVDLNTLSTDFVPDNKTNPPLAMIRLFRRICKEAKDRKFESSIYLIQPYREESIDTVHGISNLQKIALRLGIFGTFVGLILAISELAQSDLNNLDNESFSPFINQLFDNLYISFSTSISGLEVAIFISFLLMVLRNKQKIYFREMEEAVITMLSVARNSINNDEFLAEFKQVSRIVKQLETKIYDHAKNIQTSVQNVENQVLSQTEQIKEGIDELVLAKSKFDSFLTELSSIQKTFIDETKSVYDLISIKNISTELRNTIIESGSNVAESVRETENTIESQTKAIAQGMNQLAQTQLEFSNFLDQISQSQREFINDVRNAHDIVSIKQMSDELQSSINQAGDNFAKSLKSNLGDLSIAVYNLERSLKHHSNLMERVSLEIKQNSKKSIIESLRDYFK